MTLPLGMNYFDVLLLALMLLCAVRGALRGLVDEVAGLVGLILGVYAAGMWYTALGARMAPAFKDTSWAYMLAYGVILVAAMLGVALLAKALHKILKFAYADWINHLFGGVAGFLKGVLVCVVIVALLDFFLHGAEFVRASTIAPQVRVVTTWIKGAVPANLYQSTINELKH